MQYEQLEKLEDISWTTWGSLSGLLPAYGVIIIGWEMRNAKLLGDLISMNVRSEAC